MYLHLSLFSDGAIQEGDTLSPTDVEANLSTEVALTVLDVLELFVNHHKVCASFISLLIGHCLHVFQTMFRISSNLETFVQIHFCGVVASRIN